MLQKMINQLFGKKCFLLWSHISEQVVSLVLLTKGYNNFWFLFYFFLQEEENCWDEFVLHLPEQNLPGILGSVWKLRSTQGYKMPFTLRHCCGPLWKVNQRTLQERKHWWFFRPEACSRRCRHWVSLVSQVLVHPLCPINLPSHQQAMSPPWCLPNRVLMREDGFFRKVQFRLKLYENCSSTFQLLLEAQSEILQWLPLLSWLYISQSLAHLSMLLFLFYGWGIKALQKYVSRLEVRLMGIRCPTYLAIKIGLCHSSGTLRNLAWTTQIPNF